MKKIIALSTVLVLGALAMACGDSGANNANANGNKAIANKANTPSNMSQSATNALGSMANTVSNAASSVANAVKPGNDNKTPASNKADATKK